MACAMDLARASSLERDPLDLALQRELQPYERVLWKGKRIARISLGSFGIYLFAIPWTAFALFWTAMAFLGVHTGFDHEDTGGALIYAFPLFGTPFIVIGLGMLSMPFLPLFGADKTLLAVTDQRLIRLYLGRRLKTESARLVRTGRIERNERRDGSGTLKIETGSSYDSEGDRRTEHFEIGEVANVMMVEEVVRGAIERARPGALSSSASTRS
jgi:hypothetical protein